MAGYEYGGYAITSDASGDTHQFPCKFQFESNESEWSNNSSTTSSVASVWSNWTTTTTFKIERVWSEWTIGTFTTGTLSTRVVPSALPTPPKGRIISRQEFQEERERRQRSERGLDLLRFLLKPEQLRELRGLGSVRIEGSMGGLYEFGLAHPSIMYKIGPDGKAVQKYGICQTAMGYCAEDRVAAAILAFQSDEAEALKRAMVHAFGHAHEPVRVQKRRVFRELIA